MMMDSTGFIIFLIYSCLCGWRANFVHGQSNNFKVTDFGAIADGRTDSSKAFMDAWKKACGIEGGGMVSVMPLGTYLLKGASTFQGPCKGQILFNMEGSTLKAFTEPSLQVDSWISFYNIDGFKVLGHGTFYGQGSSSWQATTSNNEFRPDSIKFENVKNGLVQDIHSVDSKMFHIHFHESEGIVVSNVTISAPGNSPNTDGIHISNSNDVRVTDATIGTGDDCISIGPGSTNINISRVWCGPGHGISIGSIGRYNDEKDVSQITVRNCTLSDTDNGLRIKTWAPSSSRNKVSGVTFSEIQIRNSKNPIIIDQYYCQDDCGGGGESEVTIQQVKYEGVRGVSASKDAVNVRCSKDKPCQDIEFSGLQLTWSGSGHGATASCSNVDTRFQGPQQVPSHC